MYVFFRAIVAGGVSLAGVDSVSAESSELMMIRFCMWFLALMALNAMSVDLESEARQGTLEQCFLNAPSFLGLMWIRGFVHVLLGAGAVVVLAVLIQWTSGNWLQLNAQQAGLAILAVFINTVELLGFGLILGGLTLVFKRLGQVSAILQFCLFFITVLRMGELAEPWRTVVQHIPLAAGVNVVTLVTSNEIGTAMQGMVWLVFDAAIYALIGSVVFVWLQRQALKQGSLSHY